MISSLVRLTFKCVASCVTLKFENFIMNKAYTPTEKAYRAGILAWLGVLGAFIFLLFAILDDGIEFFDFCLIASIVSAIFGMLSGIYSLLLSSSSRAWRATILAALILAVYGLILYLMRDFCVIC